MSNLLRWAGVLFVALNACDEAASEEAAIRGTAGAAASDRPCGLTVRPEDGVRLRAELPVDLETARSWTFETCRAGDGCWVSSLAPDSQIDVVAAGEALTLQVHAQGSPRTRAAMTLRRDNIETPYIDVFWSLPSDYADGDRYTVIARNDSDSRQLIDESVSYPETKDTRAACDPSRFGVTVDKRGSM